MYIYTKCIFRRESYVGTYAYASNAHLLTAPTPPPGGHIGTLRTRVPKVLYIGTCSLQCIYIAYIHLYIQLYLCLYSVPTLHNCIYPTGPQGRALEFANTSLSKAQEQPAPWERMFRVGHYYYSASVGCKYVSTYLLFYAELYTPDIRPLGMSIHRYRHRPSTFFLSFFLSYSQPDLPIM